MMKKILGAAIGASIAKRAPVAGGLVGSAAATAIPFVLSRMALPGIAAVGVGAFVLDRYRKRRAVRQGEGSQP
jgi:fructose-specific phosphotransferase system IIC component